MWCISLNVAASLLKGLKHANIVTLHDIIHTKDTLTFVFEYVVRPYFITKLVKESFFQDTYLVRLICKIYSQHLIFYIAPHHRLFFSTQI
jgi:hypothetical protein